MTEKKPWKGYYSEPGGSGTYGAATPVSIEEATRRELARRAEQRKRDEERIKRGEHVNKG